MNITSSAFLQKVLATLVVGISFVANAQSPITMDGTTGTGTGINQNFANIAGANQTITINGDGLNANGTRNGSNMFFSFSQFGITAGDTALFQCPNGCAGVTNVISRVTGPSASNLNGTFTSTIGQISIGSPATFWFFNPNGVLGSVVTTPPSYLRIGDKADKVIFDNGAIFGLTTSPNDPTLSVPPNSTVALRSPTPTSFGFPPPPPITVINDQIIPTPTPVPAPVVEIPPVIEVVAPAVKLAPVVREIPAEAVNATLVKNPVLDSVPARKELSPCDSDDKSSLLSKGIANYIPNVSVQAPYSIAPSTKDTQSLGSEKQMPTSTLNESGKCR